MDVLNFVGGMVTVVFAITGAHIWLRWGWCGVSYIWRRRDMLDAVVDRELEHTIGD